MCIRDRFTTQFKKGMCAFGFHRPYTTDRPLDVYKRQVFYKDSYNFPNRQIKVVQAQIVVVLYLSLIHI